MKRKLLSYPQWKEKNYCKHGENNYTEWGPSENKLIYTESNLKEKYQIYVQIVKSHNDAFKLLRVILKKYTCSVYPKFNYQLKANVLQSRNMQSIIDNDYCEDIKAPNINQAKSFFANMHDVPYYSVRAIRTKGYDICLIAEPSKLFPIIDEIRNNSELAKTFLRITGLDIYRSTNEYYAELYSKYKRQFTFKDEKAKELQFFIKNGIVELNIMSNQLTHSSGYKFTELGGLIFECLFKSFTPESLPNFLHRIKIFKEFPEDIYQDLY